MSEEPGFYFEGISQQQDEVIRLIYQKFFPGIRQFILNNSGNEEDAKDMFQDAVMVIYDKTRKGRIEVNCSFYTYLFSICRNLWLRQLKEKSKLRVTFSINEEYIEGEDLEQAAYEQEQFNIYWKQFQRLGEGCQRLLNLFFQGKSMKEIAEQLGFGSERYARKRKFQCKEKLLELIGKDKDLKAY